LSLLRPAHCVLSFRRPLSLIKPSVAARPAAETQRVRVALLLFVLLYVLSSTVQHRDIVNWPLAEHTHSCMHAIIQ
jgi:hypothetical protein